MKPQEAEALLSRAGCGQDVIKHSRLVADIAREIAVKKRADIEMAEIGGLLHDIGRCKTNGITHGILGAKILREWGVDERLTLMAERHVGAGITRDEAEELGLPVRDYVPQTVEEKIVCHADNLAFGDRRINLEERLSFWEKQGLPPHILERARRLAREVEG